MSDNNELHQSVIIPRDDFLELEAAAYNADPPTAAQRIAGTAQATALFGAMAGAVTAASWGYVVAIDWLEKRRLNRDHSRFNLFHRDNTSTTTE